MENFKPDKPIAENSEDAFNRGAFAKRVALIAENANTSTSIVVGIYGKWGEGKTSVLNLIESELKDKIVTIRFNPWYFKDENDLLIHFFREISEKLGHKLTSDKTRALKAIANYGESVTSYISVVAPKIGFGTSLITQMAKKFSNETLESQKQKINEFIIKADTHFAIFIDDIDRLNIQEIQTVFRLIKLLGDFPRFTYILAFDDDLVAKSLGHQFGEGTVTDGYEYLEKIIQIPIKLPAPYTSELRKFTLTHINKALDGIKIQLSEDDSKRFRDNFDLAFTPALKNPRLAIRLSNAIAFSVPLVKGEVNISDFLTLECIRVFYPELYDFIRDNGDVFISNYDSYQINHRFINDEFKKFSKQKIDTFLKKFPDMLANLIREMLSDLFPQLKSLFSNYMYPDETKLEWNQEQRICSPGYFKRYFAYVVADGEISDTYFKQIFSDITAHSYTHVANTIKDELGKINVTDFLFKLKVKANQFSNEESKILAKAFALLGSMFPPVTGFVFFQPASELSFVVKRLVEKCKDEDRLELANQVIEIADTYNYMLELYHRFMHVSKNNPENTLLDPAGKQKISNTVIQRFQKILKSKHIGSFSDSEILSTFGIYKYLNAHAFPISLLKKEMEQNPQFALNVLRMFTPTITSTEEDAPFKTLMRDDDYRFMEKFVDVDLLYAQLAKYFGEIPFDDSNIEEGDKVNDSQLIGLFQSMYKKRMET